MKTIANLDFSLRYNTGAAAESNGDKFETALGDTLLCGDNLFLIGSEAILDKNTPGTQNTGDSLIFLFNAIADSFNIAKEDRPDNEPEWHIWLKKNAMDRTCCENAWQQIREKIDLRQYDLGQYISEELESFLDCGIKYHLVDTVFTTCIDPILEVLMANVCHRYKREFNTYNFMSGSQFEKFIKSNKGDDVKLVYLWGKIGDRKKDLGSTPIDFVYTEDDAMKSIAEYIKGANDNRNKILREVFFNRRIMAIGCRFDDWKFRFFWYSIRGDLDRLSNGTVSYSCPKPENDALYQYLENTKGLHVNNDSRLFLKQMAALMESDDLFNRIKQRRCERSNGIFISYITKDVVTTTKIFNYLNDHCSFKVWMDCHNLKASDRYTPEISRAINDCAIFVPILSSNTARDLADGNLEGYYIKEWKMAKGKTFVPITIGDYDCRSDYHTKFREICGFKDIEKDITIYSVNNMEKIVEKLNELLAQ